MRSCDIKLVVHPIRPDTDRSQWRKVSSGRDHEPMIKSDGSSSVGGLGEGASVDAIRHLTCTVPLMGTDGRHPVWRVGSVLRHILGLSQPERARAWREGIVAVNDVPVHVQHRHCIPGDIVSVAFPDTITIGIAITNLGTSSMRYAIGIFREDENLASAQGHLIHVAVARALRVIKERACHRIRVDEISDVIGVSRSVLQRRFKAALGRTINEELIHQRLKVAQSLLLETKLSLIEIAERAGFQHQEYMGAIFKSHLKRTPASFRAKAR
ncbi:MAG: helix-turn-helix domain-containing protein [Proteobacteria bacterium]|nr:helix-turn-helix domain-containing protein [Pseudomonadota bacterium]